MVSVADGAAELENAGFPKYTVKLGKYALVSDADAGEGVTFQNSRKHTPAGEGSVAEYSITSGECTVSISETSPLKCEYTAYYHGDAQESFTENLSADGGLCRVKDSGPDGAKIVFEVIPQVQEETSPEITENEEETVE